MKKGLVSFLVVFFTFSVFGFANYPIVEGNDNFTGSLGKTVGNSRAEWKASLKFGTSYYGIVDETNYKAVGTLTNTGASSIDDSTNYNAIFKTSTKLQLFADDSLYLVAQNGASIFQIYVQRSGWRRLCSLNTSFTISDDYVKAIGNELYILVNNGLYKVPHIENSLSMTEIVTDVTVKGFNYIGGKIWYTTTNSLVQCDLDGTNRQTEQTGSHFTDVEAFAVSLLDTSIVYRRPDGKYELYFDRRGSAEQVCNLPGSIGDSATNFRVDSNNDIWFTYINTTSHKLYKYDVDDSILTKYLPSNTHSLSEQQNFRMLPDLGTTVFVGEGDSIWTHTIDHKPRFQLVYNIDSVGYINEANKEIIYSCTLGVVDDNSSNFTYSKIGSTPSWINLNSSLGDSVVVTADRGTAIDSGSYTIQIRVEDDFSVSPMSDTFTTTLKVYSRQTSISSVLDSSSTEDILYSLTINLSDHDNDSAFVNQQTLPSWIALSRLSAKSFKIEGTPDEDKTDAIVNIIFTDSSSGNEPVLGEAYGFTYDTASFNLTVQEVNDAPVINSSVVTSASEGVAYSYDINASDVDNGSLTYGLAVNPTGMTINSSSGLISWTPDYSSSGDHSVKAYASDGALADSQSYTVSVVEISDNPVITSAAITTGAEGQLYTYNVEATDINHNDADLKFFFPAILSYPDGMAIDTVDSTTGIITWTPGYEQAGSYSIKVYVTDGAKNGTQTYTLTIADGNGAPSIATLLNDTTITETQTINYSISIVDANDASHTIVWKKNGTQDGTGSSYSFSTDYTSAGSYPIKVEVSDNDTMVEANFTITVNNVNRAPVLGSVSDTTVSITEGDTLTLTLNATDPDADNLSFSSTSFDAIVKTDSTFKIVPNLNSIDTIYLIVSDSDLSDTCRVILNIQAKTVGIINSLRELPKINAVGQNFPNPFNPVTAIKYSVAKENHVLLAIFDIQGRMVNRIVNQKQQVGYYTAVWNGLDSHGKRVHSGTYVYRIQMGNDFIKQVVMSLVK